MGESPVWDASAQRLLWTDIPAGTIHGLDPETGQRWRWKFDGPVGSFGLCYSGRFVVAVADRVVLFEPETNAMEQLAHIPQAKSGMRLNDGKVGPDGAFWVGGMDASNDGAPAARLYRVSADGHVQCFAEGLSTSNGLAWNADGTRMYHSDSRGEMMLDCYEFDSARGTARNRRRLAAIDERFGRADGGACDVEGHYWSCGPSQSRINRFSADGELLDWIDLPTLRPTMPCFGGADMRTVYVTSLSGGATEQELADHPLCGGIVSFRAPVAGVPVALFADVVS